MRIVQLCMAHLLVGSNFWYLQNSASGSTKTPFSGQNWLYLQSRLLSFKDIKHWKAPNDAPCKGASFTYQALYFLINSGGLNWGNLLPKTGTEPVGSGFTSKRYIRNGPKMELWLTLSVTICAPGDANWDNIRMWLKVIVARKSVSRHHHRCYVWYGEVSGGCTEILR